MINYWIDDIRYFAKYFEDIPINRISRSNDMPSIVNDNIHYWIKDGKPFRENDKPNVHVIQHNSEMKYRYNSEKQLHREYFPAIITDTSIRYFYNGIEYTNEILKYCEEFNITTWTDDDKKNWKIYHKMILS